MDGAMILRGAGAAAAGARAGAGGADAVGPDRATTVGRPTAITPVPGIATATVSVFGIAAA
jgi:hypothetical protein